MMKWINLFFGIGLLLFLMLCLSFLWKEGIDLSFSFGVLKLDLLALHALHALAYFVIFIHSLKYYLAVKTEKLNPDDINKDKENAQYKLCIGIYFCYFFSIGFDV